MMHYFLEHPLWMPPLIPRMITTLYFHTRCYTGGTRVCASNGVTYRNICRFKNAQCRRPTLTAKYYGRCRRRCSKWCSGKSYPVCGNDGITYRNLCQLHNARCQNSKIRLYRYGMCDVCMSRSRVYRPVCGTNGVTYRNHRSLRTDQCEDESLDVLYRGVCRSCVRRCVSKPNNPVCGSDDVTYRNACHMRNVQCRDKSLKKKYRGVCIRRVSGRPAPRHTLKEVSGGLLLPPLVVVVGENKEVARNVVMAA